MPGRKTERRRWVCPDCGKAFNIPATANDPGTCPNCKDEYTEVGTVLPEKLDRLPTLKLMANGCVIGVTFLLAVIYKAESGSALSIATAGSIAGGTGWAIKTYVFKSAINRWIALLAGVSVVAAMAFLLAVGCGYLMSRLEVVLAFLVVTWCLSDNFTY